MRHLADRGHESFLETLQAHAPVRVTDAMAGAASLLVHAESVRSRAVSITRASRRAGVPVAMVMDGVLEYANTFLNPAVGSKFLRPCPADAVFAAGDHDAAILGALGNRAVAAGLPRLEAFRGRVIIAGASTRPVGVLVATANTPAFTMGGRARVLAALGRIQSAIERRGLAARWRVAPELARELGVEADTAPLAESIAWARAVLTTASTLATEAMLGGRPTAIVHPHPWPLWLPAAWVHRGDSYEGFEDDVERMRALEGADEAASQAARASIARVCLRDAAHESASPGELIDSLLSPGRTLIELQGRALAACCRVGSMERCVRMLGRMAQRSSSLRLRRGGSGGLGAGRIVAERSVASPKMPGVLRVVSCIEAHASSVGGVSAWSGRMERYFGEHPEHRIDWRTLFVSSDEPPETERLSERARAAVCLIDPTESLEARAAAVAGAARSIGADVVVPNYGEACFAGADTLRARGLCRVLGVAHTNDDVYRGLLSMYTGWDVGVAVSEACAAWLGPLAGDRPWVVVPYGVPVAASCRTIERDGPLRLAYVGRVVEKQKRVSDLLRLLEALDRRGVEYVFEMVGDGDALSQWQRTAATMGLRGRLRVRGARALEWVERFWETVDVNVIVSDAEGLSVSMLESMGVGVVPCVTLVDSAVGGVVRDGENGITVPVGAIDAMADRIAGLARDRAALRRCAEMARKTIIDLGLTVEACGMHWADTIRGAGAMGSRGAARRADVGFSRACGAARAEESEQAEVVRAFESFKEAGRRRIGVWAGSNVSLATLEQVAASDCLTAFVDGGANERNSLLGVRCVSPGGASRAGFDAMVLCNEGNDLSGFVATASLRRDGVAVAPVPRDAEAAEQADRVAAMAARAIATGARVHATTDEGVIEGARLFDRARADKAPRPDMLVLRGDEEDFAIFARCALWRSEGTIVRSVRFGDLELSSPERFARIVGSLGVSARYGIYGGGQHTRRLLAYSGVTHLPLQILDDRAEPGATLQGIRVIRPEAMEREGVFAVILSSAKHEQAMWDRTARWRERGVRVVRLYEQSTCIAQT